MRSIVDMMAEFIAERLLADQRLQFHFPASNRKALLRAQMWRRLEEARVVRFPGPIGRIPDFEGAEAAARLIGTLEAWATATRVFANPDNAQHPVREGALSAGKILYMAVPRLADVRPLILLDPAYRWDPRWLSSIPGALAVGHRIQFHQALPFGLIVVGSVAVSEDGSRLGKGSGYSDLALAMCTAIGLIPGRTPIVTTVHELQILPNREIPMAATDTPVDIIVTPDEVIYARVAYPRPRGVDITSLSESQMASIPALARLLPRWSET